MELLVPKVAVGAETPKLGVTVFVLPKTEVEVTAVLPKPELLSELVPKTPVDVTGVEPKTGIEGLDVLPNIGDETEVPAKELTGLVTKPVADVVFEIEPKPDVLLEFPNMGGVTVGVLFAPKLGTCFLPKSDDVTGAVLPKVNIADVVVLTVF